MSQSSYTLANAAGAAFRAALNTLTAAIRTMNSGSTAPSETAKYMPWIDEATGLWRMRNAADSAWIVLGPHASPMPRKGYLQGMTISNNGSDATNDIDIAAGECADSTNVTVIRATASMTKRLDASWAAGTGNGGLDTGSIANTTYHVFAIQKDSDGTYDYLFSASATSPTMPSGYTFFRRIASFVRASAAIKAFVQDGDYFQWSAPVADIAATNPGTSAVTRTLTVPTGINVLAEVQVGITNSGSGGTAYSCLSDLATSDRAPSAGASDTTAAASAAGASISSGVVRKVRTNTSAQIRSRLSFSDASTSININTLGWFDTRGRTA